MKPTPAPVPGGQTLPTGINRLAWCDARECVAPRPGLPAIEAHIAARLALLRDPGRDDGRAAGRAPGQSPNQVELGSGDASSAGCPESAAFPDVSLPDAACRG
jgi:hypothetical protein